MHSPPDTGATPPPTHVPWILISGIVLCLGIVVSAATTVDSTWWMLYFSRLGTFGDASSAIFNGAIIACGAVVALSAAPLRLHLEDALACGRLSDPRTRTVVPPIIVIMGICLSLIGVIPVSLNEFIHDRAANGVLLSFIALVVACRRLTPELAAYVHRSALVSIVILTLGIAAMVSEVINLTVFEIVAFSTILSWVQVAQTCLARRSRPSHAPATEPRLSPAVRAGDAQRGGVGDQREGARWEGDQRDGDQREGAQWDRDQRDGDQRDRDRWGHDPWGRTRCAPPRRRIRHQAVRFAAARSGAATGQPCGCASPSVRSRHSER